MPRPGRQSGVVLIVVLWVVALLTVLLAAFVATVKVERQTVADISLSIQSRAAADAVLNYLAALNAVLAPELEEMPGQRYELVLNDFNVAFRVLPEAVFIPVNTLDSSSLANVLFAMGVDDAATLADTIVEWRNESVDETTGKLKPPLRIGSFVHLVHLLGLDTALVGPYEPWLSFLGEHAEVTAGYVPDAVLETLGLTAQQPLQDGKKAVWDPAAVYRVQVEVQGSQKSRKIEATVVFAESQYRLLQMNENSVAFSLNDLSE